MKCEDLPARAHDLHAHLSVKYRSKKAFEVTSADAKAAHIEFDTLSDYVADLTDAELLQRVDGGYRLLVRCPHRSATDTPRKGAWTIANRFEDAALLLDPMGAGNTKALAGAISGWFAKGIGPEAVDLMIDEFFNRFRNYCVKGSVPWRAFISNRHALLEVADRRFVEKHGYDRDFDQHYERQFGKGFEKRDLDRRRYSEATQS